LLSDVVARPISPKIRIHHISLEIVTAHSRVVIHSQHLAKHFFLPLEFGHVWTQVQSRQCQDFFHHPLFEQAFETQFRVSKMIKDLACEA